MCLNPFKALSRPAPAMAPAPMAPAALAASTAAPGIYAAAAPGIYAAAASERQRQRRLRARGAASTILSDPLASVANLPVATKTLLGQ